MSNANKSQPEDELVDGVELPTEDDFSLAALDFLSADIDHQPNNGNAAVDDFFDTGALTSLASLGWRDTDGTDSDAVAEEPDELQEDVATDLDDDALIADAELDSPEAELQEPFDSMTGPSADDDDAAPELATESFTQSVPEDDDGLLDLAESFTQSTPDEIDESLLDLAESFTGAVLETGGSADIDDEAPTVVLSPSDYISQLQAELADELDEPEAEAVTSEQDDNSAEPASLDEPDAIVEEPVSDEKMVAAEAVPAEVAAEPIVDDAADLQADADLEALAEAASDFATTIEDDELSTYEFDDAEDDLLDIAEAATIPEPVATPPSIDDELISLAEDSADAYDDEAFFDELLDLSAEDALDALDEDNDPTSAELDALLDNDSRYLDDIVARLDAESDQFVADEAQEIELLTSRGDLREGEQYVVFALGDTEYGIPVANVLEVGEPQAPTHVPYVPHWVRGIINLRGEIVSLVDLRGFLNGENGDDDGWMIISQTRDEAVTVGLLVDDVRGNRQFSSQQKTDVGAGLTDGSARYLQTVFEENGQMIAALDFDRLLNSAEMRQFEM